MSRRRGTERAVAELITRLVASHNCEVHLYAHEVEDIDVVPFGKSVSGSATHPIWHRVPRIPGPHLLQFLFWMTYNHLWRSRDRWLRGIRFDAVFSPGVNALDADVILVHAVFHRLRELQKSRRLSGVHELHRSLYYSLVCLLEGAVYRQSSLRLAAVSKHTAAQLRHYFGSKDIVVIPNGVDLSYFSASNRLALRADARRNLNYSSTDVVVLLVGNDFHTKGLPTLLNSLSLCRNLPLRLCVVGSDASFDGVKRITDMSLRDRVTFAPESTDILPFYAAADIYVAPSREDSFNLPALEAMACGVPVVVSAHAGITEYVRHGVDCLVLRNPEDPHELAETLRLFVNDPSMAAKFGANSPTTASTLSWDRHAESVYRLLNCPSSSASPQS